MIPEGERSSLPAAFLDGAWINADRPPTPDELAGSPTLVVRFHAGSPRGLASLKAASATPHAKAIGLHVPRHPREAQHRTVEHAVLREALEAPIRHDPGGLRADALKIQASGHLLLDEDARIAARSHHAPGPETWHLAETLASDTAPSWSLRGSAPPPSALLYPQGLDAGPERIALSDTGHHRVLVRAPDGTVQAFGSGLPGHEDGPRQRARFSHPRGLLVDDEHVLVADTGNGAIRRIHLDDARVETLIQANQLAPRSPSPLGPMPWDLQKDPQDETLAHITLHGEDALVKARLDAPAEDPPVVSTLTMENPTAITGHHDGLVVAQTDPPRLARVPPTHEDPHVLETPDGLQHPIALDAHQDTLTIADPYAGALHVLDASTGHALEGSPSVQGLPEPRAVAHQGDDLLHADAEHQVFLTPEASQSPTRVAFNPQAPPVDRFTRLDPLEVAPRGRVELEIVLRGIQDAPPSKVQRPDVKGPLVMETVAEPTWKESSLWTRIQARAEASGTVVASWGIEEEGDRFEAAWSLPVLLRPGGPERTDARVSARRPRGREDEAPSP